MIDIYQLLTVKSVQEDEQSILGVLASLKKKKGEGDLRLLNYYHEIPVSYPAIVEEVDGDMVELSVHQHQAVVMQDEKKVFLKSSHFPHDVVASVFRASAGKGIALVYRFAYAQIRAERRQFIRVEVAEPVSASFTAGAIRLSGRLCDISLRGASVVSPDSSGGPDEQTEGVLSVSLCGATIEISASFLKPVTTDGKMYWIFNLNPSGRAEETLSQFIFQRQLAIIKEIKETL